MLLEGCESPGQGEFLPDERDARIIRISLRSPRRIEMVPSQIENCVDERSGVVFVDPDFDRDVLLHVASDRELGFIFSHNDRSA